MKRARLEPAMSRNKGEWRVEQESNKSLSYVQWNETKESLEEESNKEAIEAV